MGFTFVSDQGIFCTRLSLRKEVQFIKKIRGVLWGVDWLRLGLMNRWYYWCFRWTLCLNHGNCKPILK